MAKKIGIHRAEHVVQPNSCPICFTDKGLIMAPCPFVVIVLFFQIN